MNLPAMRVTGMLLIFALMLTGSSGCSTTSGTGAVIGGAVGAVAGGAVGYAVGGRKGMVVGLSRARPSGRPPVTP